MNGINFRVHYDLVDSKGHCSIVHALSAQEAARELRKRAPDAIVKKIKVDRSK